MNVEEMIEVKNNDFLRQFEAEIEGSLVSLEYSSQPRQIFLTKLIMEDDLKERGLDQVFLKSVFDLLNENGTKVMPTCPQVKRFFKAHKKEYRRLLPTGINL